MCCALAVLFEVIGDTASRASVPGASMLVFGRIESLRYDCSPFAFLRGAGHVGFC